MAIKINFDAQHNPEKPTFTLATRRGTKYNGALPAENIIVSGRLNDVSETTFKVRKYANGKKYELWDKIEDFKLLYCREWNMWLEAKVEIDESIDTIKTVYGTQLGRVELSNVKLRNIEINTEIDISRDDYKMPTVLYSKDNPEASLLHRIMEKAPNYKIRYVSPNLAKEQRVFSFDDVSIYDAFQQISDELDCLFVFHTAYDDGSICREISVYDLYSYCYECGHRGDFFDICPKCGNTSNSEKGIEPGYGEDTAIFITSDDLSDSIQYVTDTDSVKNCFYLSAGDDLMTATVHNCMPNGTGYLWGITENTKEDMSQELRDKLTQYDKDYEKYQNEYPLDLDNTSVSEYNTLVDKYAKYYNTGICNYCGRKIAVDEYNIDTLPSCSDENCNGAVTWYRYLEKIPDDVVGYQNLVKYYYDTIDFALFLESEMMPLTNLSGTTANDQSSVLCVSLTGSVSVQNIGTIKEPSINSAVLSMAKILVDSRYNVKIKSSISEQIEWEIDSKGNYILNSRDEKIPTIYKWSGVFTITSASDETDTIDTPMITIEVNGDYENFVKQKLEKSLSKSDSKDFSISGLFDIKEIDDDAFNEELQKYCLVRLTSFRDACQSCLDILIEEGISSDKSDLYEGLYIPYYKRLGYIDDEMSIRQSDINTIIGTDNANGSINTYGIQDYLFEAIELIQDKLNFEKYIGEEPSLWYELCAYRREDTYTNDNYISDGLNNKELLDRAKAFINEAEKELYKSANLQHSISSSLKNLLIIDKFSPLVKYFELGNWIRMQIDDSIYKLRLISYEIDYDNLNYITVEFSDVLKTIDGMVDEQSIIDQMNSIGGSYESVKKQAKKGEDSKNVLDNWVHNSLSLTNMKIVGNADDVDITWDKHGMLFKRYLPETDTFDERQIKIINSGLYYTNDNWRTTKAGIGTFMFYNPITQRTEEAYGVIADTLIGNLVLSEEVGVYNSNGSVAINANGINVVADGVSGKNDMSISIQQKFLDAEGNVDTRDVFYVDSNGELIFTGSIKIQSSNGSISNMNDLCDDERIMTKVNDSVSTSQNYVLSQLNNYTAEVGQYLVFTGDGLKIGANNNGMESAFSTIIDNRRMSFKQNNETVAYVSGYQLYIQNATIKNSLSVGNYFFIPKSDKSMIILWKEVIEYKPVKIDSSPMKSMEVIAGEPVSFEVSVSGDIESIIWEWSLNNGADGSWKTIAKDKTTCVIEMPSESIQSENEYIKVRCTVVGKDGVSESCVTTITEILMANDENNYKEKYSITYNLNHYTSSVSTTLIVSESTYETILTPDAGYRLKNYSMTMNGQDVSSYFNTSTGKFAITVTGDIVINIVGVAQNGGLIVQDLPEELRAKRDDGSVDLTVVADGDELDFKWYCSDDNMTWNEYTINQTDTATSSTKRILVSSVEWTIQYFRCEVIDNYGNSEMSNTVALIVEDELRIIEQPVSVTVNEGETARFSIVATGIDLVYQWKMKSTNSSQFIDTPFGGTTSSFSTYAASGFNGNQYICVVTDGAGNTVTSNVVTLTVIT